MRKSLKTRRVKARWLTRQLAWAHNVLADPNVQSGFVPGEDARQWQLRRIGSQRRQAARCRINRVHGIMRRLRPIPAMKRGLDVDKPSRWERALHA